MGSSLCLVSFLRVFMKLLLLDIVVANSLNSVGSTCHDDERCALLQFRESFLIDKSFSLCNPKVLEWNSHGSNCCLWDGVQCDEQTGRVIGLDLSSSCLFVSINSNSTLFNLVHLQRLNLAGNNFNYSQIPAAIGSNRNLNGYLPELHHRIPLKELMLYESGFPGTLPSSIHMLDSLVLLTGCIPSSLRSLTALEIPIQLKQLGFLERYNVSHNNLTGRIPQGNQFNAFESSSFEGNPGLCGDPLLKKCHDLEPLSLPPSVFEENDDSKSLFELDWKVVLIGFTSGVAAGVALGDIVIIRQYGRLVKMYCKRRRQRTRQRN
nr:receptor-like protein 6 [Ziziphus jujuba var. spinosa]